MNRNGTTSHLTEAFLAINSINDGIITVDNQSRITYINRAGEVLTGWTYENAMYRNSDEVFVIVNAVTRETEWSPLKASMQDDERYSLLPNSVLIRKDGSEVAVEDSISPIHDENGKVMGAAIIFRDVSLSRLMLMNALHRSNHDALTALPNRSLLQDRIQQALISIQHRQHLVAVLFIDIDGFKEVNDTGGHSSGDLVLQEIASRMKACIQASDTLCRAGGDEFILLVPDVGESHNVKLIADKLLGCTADPFHIDNGTYAVTLSIGIAICDQPSMDSATLIEHADTAMYLAKQSGGDRAFHYTSSMNEQHQQRASIEDELFLAVERKEFVLHYQPQVDVLTREIVGVEALLRWQTVDQGLLAPLDFIPVAERSGLIVPIGQWVLREALRQQRVWRESGLPTLLMSINVSSVEISHKDYIVTLDKILKEESHVPGTLMFELTETVLLQAERETDVLSLLPQRGILLAIDDFGVGYSNLIYLRRFPVDVIKIDRYFVEHSMKRDEDSSLVKAIVDLGKSLNKVVIAEGVETEEQLLFLASIDCDQVQGFLFGKPDSANTLRRSHRLAPELHRTMRT
jgi:diguanylate cyclase (GGDEF)-like protein/PAS domain S-box-containing protein